MGARIAYLAASLAVAACLGALQGCGGGGSFNSGQRAPWRQQAEDACIAGGAVRASSYVQQMTPIDGPGVCGLERPLRVSGLADGAVALSPPALIGCPITAGLDRWIKASVQPAAIRYFGSRVVEHHADRLLWLPRTERQQLRQHLRARLRQRPRHGCLPAGERPDRSWWSTTGGGARRASGPSSRRSSPEPATSSIPCSAPVATASTTTTSTSIFC